MTVLSLDFQTKEGEKEKAAQYRLSRKEEKEKGGSPPCLVAPSLPRLGKREKGGRLVAKASKKEKKVIHAGKGKRASRLITLLGRKRKKERTPLPVDRRGARKKKKRTSDLGKPPERKGRGKKTHSPINGNTGATGHYCAVCVGERRETFAKRGKGKSGVCSRQ